LAGFGWIGRAGGFAVRVMATLGRSVEGCAVAACRSLAGLDGPPSEAPPTVRRFCAGLETVEFETLQPAQVWEAQVGFMETAVEVVDAQVCLACARQVAQGFAEAAERRTVLVVTFMAGLPYLCTSKSNKRQKKKKKKKMQCTFCMEAFGGNVCQKTRNIQNFALPLNSYLFPVFFPPW